MQIFPARFFGLPHWRRVAQVGREHFAAAQGPNITVQADAAVPVAQHGQHFVFFPTGQARFDAGAVEYRRLLR